jgi:hypothetical protein
VSKELLRHQVVGLDGGVNVLSMDADGYTHQHVLRTFDNFPFDFQQVTSFEGFEPEVLKSNKNIVLI